MLDKQKIQKFVEDYKIGSLSKEEIDKQISKIREVSDTLKEKVFSEKNEEFKLLESKKRDLILDAVKGYEENSDIDVDWDYLSKPENSVQVTSKEITEQPIKITISDKDDKVNIGKNRCSQFIWS